MTLLREPTYVDISITPESFRKLNALWRKYEAFADDVKKAMKFLKSEVSSWKIGNEVLKR